jgi:hypothetical protein
MSSAIVALICIYVAGFAWSWGPLGWLVPSEIQPLETRAAGMGIATLTNFLFTFLIGQVFLVGPQSTAGRGTWGGARGRAWGARGVCCNVCVCVRGESAFAADFAWRVDLQFGGGPW